MANDSSQKDSPLQDDQILAKMDMNKSGVGPPPPQQTLNLFIGQYESHARTGNTLTSVPASYYA